MSINVRGLADSTKRRAIMDYHRFNADVLIMQETHSTPDIESIWQNEWGSKIIFSHGTGAARGTAVLFSKKIEHMVKNIQKANDGRYVIFDIHHPEQVLTICAIYAPNKDTPQYFQEIGKILRDRQEHKVLIGDFNLVLDVEMDRLNTYCNNNKAKEEVENLMDEFQLKDIWRVHYPNRKEYSWTNKSMAQRKSSRIDFSLVSAGLDQKVPITQYTPSIKTDHRAFYMTLDLDSHQRGTGYWKLNTQYLQEQKYIQEMNEELNKTITNHPELRPCH